MMTGSIHISAFWSFLFFVTAFSHVEVHLQRPVESSMDLIQYIMDKTMFLLDTMYYMKVILFVDDLQKMWSKYLNLYFALLSGNTASLACYLLFSSFGGLIFFKEAFSIVTKDFSFGPIILFLNQSIQQNPKFSFRQENNLN